ncbi:hypothetical protein XELAEV_180167801mg, partial [Xenopus laevis]
MLNMWKVRELVDKA